MTTRHRLNRGGHRQANAALYRVVIVRMQHHAADPRLRRPPHRRRQDQSRDHPLPETAPRPRDLGPHATPPRSTAAARHQQLDGYRSINALAESVIGLYKTRATRRALGGVEDLELATLSWVHWFNETRLHGSIGYLPPVEYENDYYRQITSRQQTLPGEVALH